MKNWSTVFLLYFIFGLLIFFNSLNNKFLMDDYAIMSHSGMNKIKNNLSLWDPYRDQASGVVDSSEVSGYYRPLSHLVYNFCYASFKNSFWKYHLLNLLLFVSVSSLIYLLIEKLTRNFFVALLAGFFYLVHPINGIVVNYISASVFALQVLCLLGSILLLWNSLEKNYDRRLYFLSLFLFSLSLFWHESSIVSPFYLSIVFLLFREDGFKKKAFYLFPFFLIVFFYILFRASFGYGNDLLGQMLHSHLNMTERGAGLFQAYAWYISKLFYPQGIVMQWATPLSHQHVAIHFLGLTLLAAILVLFWLKFSQEKICQLAIIWLIIGFMPVALSAFRAPEIGVIVEPHWFIFSSIGFFVLFAHCFTALLGRAKVMGVVLLMVLIFSWSAISHANDRLWFDQKTYALYWSQQVPQLKMPYFYIADAFQRIGKIDTSRKYYQLALSEDPRSSWNVPIFDQLGNFDMLQKHFKEAETNFQLALKISPDSADTYDDLGALYFAEGNFDKARWSFKQSMYLNPRITEPRIGLALIYLKNSENQKAIDLCLQNLDIINNDPQTLRLLISIFLKEFDTVDLKKYTDRFIKTSDDPKGLLNLGIQMAGNGYPDIAWNCIVRSIHMAPDYKEAYLAAGVFQTNLRQYDKAIQIWELGEKIDPSDRRFSRAIAQIQELELK